MNEKEQMIEAYGYVVDDMLELLTHKPEDGLRWNSTKQDLMEMTHLLYESERVVDEFNVPVPFNTLVRRVCGILHERVPRNPSSYVRQSNQCQGMRRQKLLLRYNRDYIQYYIV